VLRANFNDSAGGEPGVLSGLDHRLAEITGAHAVAATALIAFVELLLACAPWVSHRRSTLFATLGVLAILWVAGENLGSILTWTASDIGIMPLLALIALGAYDSQVPTRAHSGIANDDHSLDSAAASWRRRTATAGARAFVES
jgi:hypothetical protein